MAMAYEAAAIGLQHYTNVLNDETFEYDQNISYSELLEDDSFQLQLADFVLSYGLGDLQNLIDWLTEAEYAPVDAALFAERWAVTFSRMSLMDIWLAVLNAGNGIASALSPLPGQEAIADIKGMVNTMFSYYDSILADFCALVLDELAQDAFGMSYFEAEIFVEPQEWNAFEETANYFRGLSEYSYTWIVSCYLKNLADMNGIEVLFDEAGMVWEAMGIGLFEVMLNSLGASFRYNPDKKYSGFMLARYNEMEGVEDVFTLILDYDIGSADALETALIDAGYTQPEATEFIAHMAEVFAYQSLPSLMAAISSEDAQAELVSMLYTPALEEDIEDMAGVTLAYFSDILSWLEEDISGGGEEPVDFAMPQLLWILAKYMQNFAAMNGIAIAPGAIEPDTFSIKNYELKEELTRTGISIAFAEAQGVDVEEVEVDETLMQALLDAILLQDMADVGMVLQGILLREDVTSDDLLIVSLLSLALNENLDGLDVVVIADILRIVTSYSFEELFSEVEAIEEFVDEELEGGLGEELEDELEELPEELPVSEELLAPGSRVLKNLVKYILEGWNEISLEAGGLFDEEDDTLDGVLAWVTALHIKNMAAINAEEITSIEKSSAPVGKQERLDNRASRKQLVSETKMDAVIESFRLDNSEIYDTLDVGSALDSYYRGELDVAALAESAGFQEVVIVPAEALATAFAARVADKTSKEFTATRNLLAAASIKVSDNMKSSEEAESGNCVTTATASCEPTMGSLTNCAGDWAVPIAGVFEILEIVTPTMRACAEDILGLLDTIPTITVPATSSTAVSQTSSATNATQPTNPTTVLPTSITARSKTATGRILSVTSPLHVYVGASTNVYVTVGGPSGANTSYNWTTLPNTSVATRSGTTFSGVSEGITTATVTTASGNLSASFRIVAITEHAKTAFAKMAAPQFLYAGPGTTYLKLLPNLLVTNQAITICGSHGNWYYIRVNISGAWHYGFILKSSAGPAATMNYQLFANTSNALTIAASTMDLVEYIFRENWSINLVRLRVYPTIDKARQNW